MNWLKLVFMSCKLTCFLVTSALLKCVHSHIKVANVPENMKGTDYGIFLAGWGENLLSEGAICNGNKRHM